jgi:hypothetical protein
MDPGTQTLLDFDVDANGGMTIVGLSTTTIGASIPGYIRAQCFDASGVPTGADVALTSYDTGVYGLNVLARVARARMTKQSVVLWGLRPAFGGNDYRVYYAYLDATCTVLNTGRLDPALGEVDIVGAMMSDNGIGAVLFNVLTNPTQKLELVYINASGAAAPIDSPQSASSAAFGMRRTTGDTIVVTTTYPAPGTRQFRRFAATGTPLDPSFVPMPASATAATDGDLIVGMNDDGAFSILAQTDAGTRTWVADFYDNTAVLKSSLPAFTAAASLYDTYMPIANGNFVFLVPTSTPTRDRYSPLGVLVGSSPALTLLGNGAYVLRLDGQNTVYWGRRPAQPTMQKNPFPL